jgi:hypothetical protein
MYKKMKEPWWTDTGRRETNHSEEHLSQCHSVYMKSQRDWPGILKVKINSNFI